LDLWFLEAFFNLVLGKNYNRDTTHAASSTSSSTHASVHAYAKHAPVKQLVNSKLSSTAHHSSSPPPIKSSHSSSTLLSQGQFLADFMIDFDKNFGANRVNLIQRHIIDFRSEVQTGREPF